MNKINILIFLIYILSVEVSFSDNEDNINFDRGVNFSVKRVTVTASPDEDSKSKNLCGEFSRDSKRDKTNILLRKFLRDLTGEGGLIKQDLIEKFGKYELLSENIEHAYYREPSEPFYEIKNAFWKFDGIILNVKNIHPTSNNTYWVEKASIISNKHLQNFPLKIGDSIDKAQCFFGRFLIRDRKNKNVSYTNFSDSIDVRISFNDYLLVDKIDFEYFTD